MLKRRHFAAVLTAVFLTFACDSAPEPEAESAAAKEDAEAVEEEEEPEPLTGKHLVIVDTTKGQFTMELDADAAPTTVQNFLDYVDRKFYDRTLFHRVLKNRVVHGGGYRMDQFTQKLRRKMTREPIPNESDNGLKHAPGTVAMARAEDPDSATSQFFINLRNNRNYNRDYDKGDGFGYCVFGKVVEGMDAVREMGQVETGSERGLSNVPTVPIIIKSIRRAPPEDEEAETAT